jgi:hypothetical protein
MSFEDLTPRQREFGDRFTALMAEFHDVVGPVDMDDIDDSIINAGGIAELPSVEGSFLSEWVILTAWSTMDGKVYTSKYTMPGLAGHHQLGLITRWYSEMIA